MPYCSRCGIEVDEHVDYCPLCKSKIQHFEKAPDIPGNFPDDDMTAQDYFIPFEKKRKIFWSVFSFLVATALLIIFAVNFFFNRTITWGWIPLFSLLFTWGLTAALYYLYKRIYFLLLSIYILLIIYLYFIFFVIQHNDLFFRLALPILSISFVAVLLVVLFCRKTKKRGYNIIGFILTGTAFLCAGIDIIVTFYITSKVILTWSIAVISLLIPVVLFLFYIHYMLKWTPDIKKIFHI